MSRCTCPNRGHSHLCPVHGLKQDGPPKRATGSRIIERTKPIERKTRMKGKTFKQAFLDGEWFGNRDMYIHIARTKGLEQELFACDECGRWCPPKARGYESPEGFFGEADHETPRSKSGTYRANNFRWVCAGRPEACHTIKHGRPWPEQLPRLDDYARSST